MYVLEVSYSNIHQVINISYTLTISVILWYQYITFLCIRNPNTLAIFAPELPAMERTLYAASHHPTSHGQVGTQMRAVSIHNVCLPFLAPEHCHLLTFQHKPLGRKDLTHVQGALN